MPSKKWSENDVRVLRNAGRCIAETHFPGKFDATQVRNFANRQGITKGGIGAGGTSKKKKRKLDIGTDDGNDSEEFDALGLEERLEMAKSEDHTNMTGSGLAPHEITISDGVWLMFGTRRATRQ